MLCQGVFVESCLEVPSAEVSSVLQRRENELEIWNKKSNTMTQPNNEYTKIKQIYISVQTQTICWSIKYKFMENYDYVE